MALVDQMEDVVDKFELAASTYLHNAYSNLAFALCMFVIALNIF